MALPTSQEFLPNIISVDSSCGCTLTRASFTGLTPERFAALSGTEVEIARMIATSAEAKMLGVPERGITTLLKSTVRNVKDSLTIQRVDGSQSIILPYMYRRQRQTLNANYYSIVSSADTPGAGTGDVPANAVDFTLGLGPSPWKSPLKNIERYFLPGMTLVVMDWDNNSDRNSRTIQYEIISAVNANSGSTEQATVTAVPLGKTVPSRPTFGVVQIAANNVSDWEYWCNNQPTDNPLGLLVNWIQTTRESRCVSDVYRSTLEKVLAGKTNAYDQTFKYLPVSEQNKIAAKLSEDAWLRSVFFNDYLSAAQTVEGYANLPTVEDPEQPGCILEYKANAPGIHTILAENLRLIDMNGAALNINDLFEQIYYLKRHRESDGDRIDTIDIMTDRQTAAMIYEVMAKYYKARYGVDTTRFVNLGQKVEFNNIVNFEYDSYDLPEAGVTLAVFRDSFFDDLVLAFNPTAAGGTEGEADDFRNRGRFLWLLDWSDIKVGIAGSTSVVRRNPDPNTSDLYKCRINVNVKEYRLSSTRWTVMVDRPHRHLIVQNFNLVCPTISAGLGCTVPNPDSEE